VWTTQLTKLQSYRVSFRLLQAERQQKYLTLSFYTFKHLLMVYLTTMSVVQATASNHLINLHSGERTEFLLSDYLVTCNEMLTGILGQATNEVQNYKF
jgi:hypothetical protein